MDDRIGNRFQDTGDDGTDDGLPKLDDPNALQAPDTASFNPQPVTSPLPGIAPLTDTAAPSGVAPIVSSAPPLPANVPTTGFQGTSWDSIAANQTPEGLKNVQGFAQTYSNAADQARTLGYRGSNDGTITNPFTGEVVGNLNDPNFNPSTLQRVMNPDSGEPMTQGINPLDQTQGQGARAAQATMQAPASTVTQIPQVQGATAAPQGAMNPIGAGMMPTAGSPTPGALPSVGTMTPAGNVALSKTDPNNSLLGQTIARAPGADRFKLAQDNVNTWNEATQPQFEADLRAAKRIGAGKGQLGFGQLRTRQGDITEARDTQRNALQKQYFNDALENAIRDSFGDVGVAQQQQGFQQGQQESAFGQGVTQTQLEDQLTNSDFGRALQQAIFGSQGSPADTQLALANYFSRQGQNAGTAAGAQGKASAAQSTGNTYLDALRQYLESLGMGGGQTGTTAPDTIGLPAGAS